jgi:class 3 adenylate cyclase/tetratricopeptide (TPR) repeat protein
MPSLETVTILITDLVGSTGMASRLGPAAAEELRQEHFSVLRSAIGDTEGREVKNTGDGLMLAFSSPSQAVDCAVAMQQQLELRNADATEQITVRIGIGAGEATHEDGDYFGMPPTEAARLCDAAAGGQILTSALVQMMAAGRHGEAFRGVGELELKGLPSPYQAFEVTWEPAQRDTIPLPQPLRGVPPIGYVGRQGEREALEGLWAEARDGSRRLVLLSGEPGIGKTRLSTHTALTCHGEGAMVLFGRCSEELGAPYQPWIEALSHYVEHGPDDVLAGHVERRGGELTRLVPGLARRVESVPEPRGSDPETERYLLFGAVLGMLEDAAADGPVVLILDDLHWADAQSLALLRHVVAGSGGLRLLVLGTFRDSELDRHHPLTDALAALRREEGVERLSLTGLEAGDVVAIMEAAAGHDMDETGLALGREIATETDGNPFFVAELLRHLSESGVLAQRDDGRWELKGPLSEIGMPQSVREVVGRRVERLGDKTHGVLTVAAVIGREFDVELLERVAREDEEELLDLLEEAVESSLLVESGAHPGRFMFAHALINHTLYEEHGVTRRARLHLRIAEALEDICGSDDPGPRLAELAHHWSAATASIDPSKAMDYSRRAAERALEELAPDEALKWFSNALELEDQRADSDKGDRCDILIGLGQAQRQSGQAEYRDTLLEAARLARELDDGDRLARAALANSRGYTSEVGIVDDDRVAGLRAAVERVPAADPRSPRLRSLLGMELAYGGELDERRSLTDEALAAAREQGDPQTVASVLIDRFFAIWTTETAAERREVVDELAAMAESGRLEDPLARFWGLGSLACDVGLESGDLEGVERGQAHMREADEQLGEPFVHWCRTWFDGSIAIARGRLEEGDSLMEEAVAMALESGQGDAMTIYVAQLIALRREQGRMDELVDLLVQAVEDNPGLPAFAGALAYTYTEAGHEDEARALLEEGAAKGFRHIGLDVTWLSGQLMYAEVAGHLKEPGAAAAIAELLEPHAGLMCWNGGLYMGPVASYLGRLASVTRDDERAEAHFAAAVEALESFDAPLFLARTRMWWAESLLERGGEEARARELLEQAAAEARERGCPPVERRATELLAAAAAT